MLLPPGLCSWSGCIARKPPHADWRGPCPVEGDHEVPSPCCGFLPGAMPGSSSVQPEDPHAERGPFPRFGSRSERRRATPPASGCHVAEVAYVAYVYSTNLSLGAGCDGRQFNLSGGHSMVAR